MSNSSMQLSPGGRISKAAIVLLATAALLEAWSAVFSVGIAGLNDEDISISSAIYALLLLVRLVVTLVTAVFFCIWWHRTRTNLKALGAYDLEYSPAAAVWSFFIPFLNLVRPANVAQETWKASDPRLQDNGPASRKTQQNYGLVTAWWASFVIGGGAERVALKSKDAAFAVPLAVAGHMLYLTSAISAILLIRRINRRQEERFRSMAGVFKPESPVVPSPSMPSPFPAA